MNIILIAPIMDEISYNRVQVSEGISQPGQKFYQLLYKGLKANGVNVKVYSFIDSKYDKYIDRNSDIIYQIIKGTSYIEKINAYNHLAKEITNKNNKNDIILADGEAYWTLRTALKSRKIKGNKVVALITDFPHNVYSYSSQKSKQNYIVRKVKELYAYSKLRTLSQADAFILLTKQMHEVISKKKPWIVIEGFSDSDLINSEVNIKKTRIKNIVYLGALNGKSGIIQLIKAFMNIQKDNIKLDIYGTGEYVDKIKDYCIIDPRIKYYGVVSLDEIVKIEQDAYLLINPRPSKQEFNKYSFPSKTLEYMASGTPVVSTKLEGIPSEYNEFLYLIDDNTVDIMTNELTNIISKECNELINKGLNARQFALNQKNNIVQSSRIIEFIKSL